MRGFNKNNRTTMPISRNQASIDLGSTLYAPNWGMSGIDYKFNHYYMTQPSNTGTYIALAAILVSILAHFNIVIGQDSIEAIIAGAVALYGVLHQTYNHVAITGKIN